MPTATDQGQIDRERWRGMIRSVADALAPGWERQRARIEQGVAPVRESMLRELAPRPGDTVLELAAGAGDTGFEAAAIAGENGRLISTDFSPAMVDVARRRGAELGLRNVQYRVMDGEQLELDADSVDGVLCRFGYMFIPDVAAALSETRRVLRRGGRAALAVWGMPERNPWAVFLAETLIERGHASPPEPGAPNPFGMADAIHTRALLERAGFVEVRLWDVEVRFTYRDVDDYVVFATDTAGPFASTLRDLTDGDREAVKAQLRRSFAPFAGDQGYELPGVALVGVAS